MARSRPHVVTCHLARAALGIALGALAACAQNGTAARGAGGADDLCPIDADALLTVERGDAPVVITSTHGGRELPGGCDDGAVTLRPLVPRSCDSELEACQSGPCRAGGEDRNAREISERLVDALSSCLGHRPSLVIAETSRALVDMNRDAHDPALGQRCALEDGGAQPYWDAFHRAVEGEVAAARSIGGERALLLDVHTFGALPAAPPPSIMFGAGEPFGLTLPHLRGVEPELPSVFGPTGLRAALLDALHGAQVFPPTRTAPQDGLFKGRYVVHRYARTLTDETAALPAIDALQIEISSRLRDDPERIAAAIGGAVCAAWGARLDAQGQAQR